MAEPAARAPSSGRRATAGRRGRADVFAGLAGPLLALAAEAARDPRPDATALAAEVAPPRRGLRDRGARGRGAARRGRRGPRRAARGLRGPGRAATRRCRAGRWAAAPPQGAARRAASPTPRRSAAAAPPRRRPARRGATSRASCATARRRSGAAPAPRERPRACAGASSRRSRFVAGAGGLGRLGRVALLGAAARGACRRPRRRSPPAAGGPGGGRAAARPRSRRRRRRSRPRAGDSPPASRAHLGRYGPAAAARRRYVAAVDALLPGPLAEALAAALRHRGRLAGALRRAARRWRSSRARRPGSRASSPAGWRTRARPTRRSPGSRRTPRRSPARRPGFAGPDPELLAQARGIAAEGDPAAFAFLELARDPAIRALPGWTPAAVPDLATGAWCAAPAARSTQAIPGLFTAAGWAAASGGGARAAIDRAAEERERVVGAPARRRRCRRRRCSSVLQRAHARRLGGGARRPPGQAVHRPAGLGADQRHPRPQRLAARGAVPRGLARGRRRGPQPQPRATSIRDRRRVRRDDPVRRAGAHGRDRPALRRAERRRSQALDADAEVGRRRLMDVQAPRHLDRHPQPGAAAGGADHRGRAGADRGDPGGAAEAAGPRWPGSATTPAPAAIAIADRYPFGAGADADLARRRRPCSGRTAACSASSRRSSRR